MTRARPTSRALGAVAVVGALVASMLVLAPGPATAAEEDDTPLSVALTSMTPSAIPRRGAITLAGTVSNESEDAWSEINVAPFIATTPITTRSELAVAAETGPEVAVGDRLTDAGTYVGINDLEPGEKAAFRIRIPVSSLLISGDPGVYWIGVHALGSNVDGRDQVADGRVRTFIPLVTPATARRRSVPVSVVLPLRERARRAADGSLNGPTRWSRLTSPSGRLTRLAEFGASAGDTPVSWLVDPAVLDALDDFSEGNPPLSLGPAEPADETEESPGAEPSPSDEPSPSEVPAPVPGAPSDTERSRAGEVLDRFVGTVRGDTVFTLGYADPDVAALARQGPALLRRADDLGARRMDARELNGSPAVAPPQGYFDPDLLDRLDPGTLLFLTDRGRVGQPALSRLSTGQELVLVDERAGAGGPAPTPEHDILAMRQRILSEAALEVSKGASDPRPLVVALPPRWDPGPGWREADFFGGLETGWSRLAAVPRGATTTYDGELAYSREQRADEIGPSNIRATRTLVRTSGVLDDLLANVNDVTERLTGAALQAAAYSARISPRLAAAQVREIDATVRAQMERVEVSGTDFVTLSGGSGSLTVSLVNGLEQPITVGIAARTGNERVRVEAPDPVRMQPGERTTLRLHVTSEVGVHDVTLFPVTVEGETLGTPMTFSLRTSQVGRLIWYVIIAGGALLAVTIVRRIVMRIRDRRWRPSEDDA